MASVREEDVLMAKDPAIEDSDQWPEFSLSRITVLSQDLGRPVSLLEAHEDCPVKVLGKLEPVGEEQLHLVRSPTSQAKTIVLNYVKKFSFAQYEDGSCGFWAEGNAGWFEIKNPNPTYRHVYEQMEEAAAMFYMLSDKWTNGRKTQKHFNDKGIDVYGNSLFDAFLAKPACRRGNIEDVRKGFHEHRNFLIKSMLKGEDGQSWEEAPILRYYKQKYPNDFAAMKAIVLSDGDEEYEPRSKKSRKSKPEQASSLSEPRSRAKRPGLRTPVQRDLESDNEMEDDSEDDQIGPHKTKSILQPKSSKYSKKAAGRRRSLPLVDDPQDDELSNNEPELDGADDPPAPPQSNPPVVPLARTRMRRRLQMSDAERQAPYIAPPGYFNYPKDPPMQQVTLVAYDLPTFRTEGPDDLWTCKFHGCLHQVYQGSTPGGIQQIKDHFSDHSRRAQEKLDLVYRESRPYLPVKNLLRWVGDEHTLKDVDMEDED